MTRTDIAALHLVDDRLWAERLRRLNLLLFALMPLLLLTWRGGADAAASIIGVSYIAVLVSGRRWDIARHPLLLSLLVIWLILTLLVSPFAIDPTASFSRSLPWLRFALLFAAVVTWLFRSRSDLKLVLALWTATIAFSMVDGLVQLIRGTSLTGNPMYLEVRITGPLERPNIGMFVARVGFPLLPVALLLLPQRVLWPALATGLMAIAGFIFILLTGERAAALLVLLAIVTAGLGSVLVFPRYRLYGIAAIGGVAALLTIVAMISDRIMTRVKQFVVVIQDFQSSHYGELFGVGLEMWRDHPLLGVGLKNFTTVCNARFIEQMSDGCPQHPHNVYIEWLAESGIAGLLGYLAFVVLLVLAAWPLLRGNTVTRMIGLLVAGSMVLLLFPLTASQSIFSNWPALLFWIGLSLTFAATRLALKDAR